MSILEYIKQRIALDLDFWQEHWLFMLILIVGFPCVILWLTRKDRL